MTFIRLRNGNPKAVEARQLSQRDACCELQGMCSFERQPDSISATRCHAKIQAQAYQLLILQETLKFQILSHNLSSLSHVD